MFSRVTCKLKNYIIMSKFYRKKLYIFSCTSLFSSLFRDYHCAVLGNYILGVELVKCYSGKLSLISQKERIIM